MYQIKRFIDLFISLSMLLLLSSLFDKTGIYSVTYIANEYSTYHFCIMVKDLTISFPRVIVKTLIFNVLFAYKATVSFVFCRMKIVHDSGPFKSFLSQTFPQPNVSGPVYTNTFSYRFQSFKGYFSLNDF